MNVDGEVGTLSGPHPSDLQLLLVALVHLGLHHDPEVLLGVLLPNPGKEGQVDVHSPSSVRPQLDAVSLDLVDVGLARHLVHEDVVDLDDGPLL